MAKTPSQKHGTPSRDPAVKAAVIAALLAGQSVSQVAKEYKLPKGTVSNWKNRKMAGVRPQEGKSSLTIIETPIARVIPYARNPRKNATAIAKVAASLWEFGWRQPIVCDADMVVIAGHTRLAAAQQLGMKTVPVHIATGLSKAQVAAYRLSDNRTGAEATWDEDLLAIELTALKTDGFYLALTGFDDAELARLLGTPPSQADGDGDGAQLGDVEYQVIVSCPGEHAQATLCQELEARGLKCRLLTL